MFSPVRVVHYSTIFTVRYSTIFTVQCSTIFTVQHDMIQCNTVQYGRIQYSTVQYSTVQYVHCYVPLPPRRLSTRFALWTSAHFSGMYRNIPRTSSAGPVQVTRIWEKLFWSPDRAESQIWNIGLCSLLLEPQVLLLLRPAIFHTIELN